jgi:hypothetical protein
MHWLAGRWICNMTLSDVKKDKMIISDKVRNNELLGSHANCGEYRNWYIM